jgi:hypothetical protein
VIESGQAVAPTTRTRKTRGMVTGVVFGLTQFCLFGTYGLLFWFGAKLVGAGKYTFQVRRVC